MNTLQYLILAALAVSLVVTFIMKMPSASRRAARKRLAAARELDETSADGSLVKVTGIVRVREHGERFVSPLSETRCVVLRTRVSVRHGRDPRAKLVETVKAMPFVIEDSEGKVLVDSEHVLLDVAPVKLMKDAGPRKNQYLAELGHEGANSEASEFEETVVEVGTTCTVAGSLAKQGDAEFRLTGTQDQPVAIRVERLSNQANEP